MKVTVGDQRFSDSTTATTHLYSCKGVVIQKVTKSIYIGRSHYNLILEIKCTVEMCFIILLIELLKLLSLQYIFHQYLSILTVIKNTNIQHSQLTNMCKYIHSPFEYTCKNICSQFVYICKCRQSSFDYIWKYIHGQFIYKCNVYIDSQFFTQVKIKTDSMFTYNSIQLSLFTN